MAARPPARSTEAIIAAERAHCSEILALPQAKANRVGAEGLAFGSSATVAEAAAALARAADKKAAAREASRQSMAASCGLAPKPLTAGAKRMLVTAAYSRAAHEKSAAIARLAAHGLDAKGN